ncbi:MAG: sugar phosphate nucleotidyltransferase [Promethearchaeota archaeon]
MIILAAGESRRLYPLVANQPTCMLRFLGKPLLEYQIKALVQRGIREIHIVRSEKDGQIIEDYFGSGSQWQCFIDYSIQKIPRGVGDTISCGVDNLLDTGSFMVLFSDVFFYPELISRLFETYNTLSPDVLTAITLVHQPRKFGVVEKEPSGRITSITEKPTTNAKRSHYVSAGFFILDNNLVGSIRQNKMDFIATLSQAISEGQHVHGVLWEKDWIDITHPWDVLFANRMIMNDNLRESNISPNVTIEANVNIEHPIIIERNAHIRSGASLIGPVYIGEGATVGHNALMRSHSAIDKNAVVGFTSEIKNSLLMEGARLHSLIYLGDSIIDRYAVIGAGSTSMNFVPKVDGHTTVHSKIENEIVDTELEKCGVVVGEYSVVAVNNTLYPGIKLAPNTLTQPGEIIKEDQ